MRFITTFLLFIVTTGMYSQCGNRYKNLIFPNVDISTHVYGENMRYNGVLQSLKMDVYTPRGDIEKDRPCVVFCFGGAFVQGSRSSLELVYFSNYFAQMGFVCVSIDYRLDDTANFRVNGEFGAVVRAVQDAKAAIRFLKSKSNEFQIDSNMIFIGGTSAGGVTALTLGYSQYEEFSPSVKMVIDNLGGWEGTTNALTNSSKVKGLFNFSGALFDTSHISTNDLPVYLNHATQDKTVPFYSGYSLNGQSTTLVQGSGLIAQRMKSLGNYYVIDSFQTANHPAFSDFSLLVLTTENLRKFLYKVIGCENTSSSIAQSQSFYSFPNPVHDIIQLPSMTKPENIVIYNQLGQVVYSKTCFDDNIIISDLKSGVYFLNFQHKIYKLVKQ